MTEYYVFDTEQEALAAESAICQIGGTPITGNNAKTGKAEPTKAKTVRWAIPQQRLDGKWVFQRVPQSILDTIPTEQQNQFDSAFDYTIETFSADWFETEEWTILNNKDMATYSDWVSVTDRTDPKPLEDEPRNVRVEKLTANSRKLLWEASELGEEDEYEVRIKKVSDDSDGEIIVVIDKMHHTFTSLDYDTDYLYEVRSVKK